MSSYQGRCETSQPLRVGDVWITKEGNCWLVGHCDENGRVSSGYAVLEALDQHSDYVGNIFENPKAAELLGRRERRG